MSTLEPGRRLTHYRIEARLGAGGMGEVYLARDLKLDRPVAIKVLPPWASEDSALAARFLEEARLASVLTHPNIVTIYSIDEEAGLHFIVMEYVEGETLRARARRQPLAIEDLISVGAQVAEALAAAHAVGLIHRDIKSANILLTPQGQAKVLDFGIAKRVLDPSRQTGEQETIVERTVAGTIPIDSSRLTGEQDTVVERTVAGTILGSPSYMSPEQARGDVLDGRSDIFSLGCALYEAATGNLAFEGGSILAILHAVATTEPPVPSRLRADLPPEFDAVLARAMAKDRDERYSSAREVSDALLALREGADTRTGTLVAPRQALTRSPNNLTVPLTTFVGRRRERAEIRRLLGSARVVTLHGAGGTGKTRLAIQVATDVLIEYPDGAWLVELEALTDPTLVVQGIASVVGVREEAGKPLLRSLAEALETKRMLLVLDNCEHLAAAVAAAVKALLGACPGLSILVTSREALGVPGEVVWRTPTLGAPDPRAAATLRRDAIARYEAVRLFLDRAASAQPAFQLTDQNAPIVARICHRLDGIPLAIELAAARVKVLSPDQILDRLQDRFRLLTAGSRTALPRHQTLRAAVDWSYELLSAQEKSLLNRLSVFAGGCELEAVEGVCCTAAVDVIDVIDLLTHLVDKSLVSPEEMQDGDMRYALLETIRDYGRERLEADGEGEACRERHGAYFQSLVAQAEPQLQGPQQSQWFRRLEREHDNIRTAMQWFLRRGAGEALTMGGALWRFWWVRGFWSEGRSVLVAALARDAEGRPHAARPLALYGMAVLARGQGDYAAAHRMLDESLGIAREHGDKPGVAAALFELGNLANDAEDLKKARALYEESLAIRRELEDRRGISSALHNLGVVAAALEDFEGARTLYEEALAYHRGLGNRAWEAASLNGLGGVALYRGDLQAARTYQEQGLALQRDLGDKRGIAFSLRELGRIAERQMDHAAAEQFHKESLSILRDLGDRQGMAESLEGLASAAAASGRPVRALRLAGAAAGLRELIHAPLSAPDQHLLDGGLEQARALLGPEAAGASFEAGRCSALEEAVASALE
jgi:non-specific serine/threonine protein kinase